mmetsp:Transcript_3474/g.9199  ORF Transcript_3474/g.9199 Transcript_3474/m.9199 type:complete len:99 (+) Transcript_3474:77-373(+)
MCAGDDAERSLHILFLVLLPLCLCHVAVATMNPNKGAIGDFDRRPRSMTTICQYQWQSEGERHAPEHSRLCSSKYQTSTGANPWWRGTDGNDMRLMVW